MKLKLLVIINHNVMVNYVLSFVHTAHHAEGVGLVG